MKHKISFLFLLFAIVGCSLNEQWVDATQNETFSVYVDYGNIKSFELKSEAKNEILEFIVDHRKDFKSNIATFAPSRVMIRSESLVFEISESTALLNISKGHKNGWGQYILSINKEEYNWLKKRSQSGSQGESNP